MRYLIISDIHANAQALEAVLTDAGSLGYDATLCLGDLVGYGGDPAAVVERVLALDKVTSIRGNHDKVCAGLESSEFFNDVAKHSIDWTRGVLSAGQLQALADLDKGPRLVGDAVEICHGAPFDEDYYVFTMADAGRAIDSASAPICLFGHTHLPGIFATADDPAVPPSDADGVIGLPRSGPVLINVGSVGQPRDGDPRAAYGLLDLDARTIHLRRVVYDIEGAQQRILDAGLPPWLAQRLSVGR